MNENKEWQQLAREKSLHLYDPWNFHQNDDQNGCCVLRINNFICRAHAKHGQANLGEHQKGLFSRSVLQCQILTNVVDF